MNDTFCNRLEISDKTDNPDSLNAIIKSNSQILGTNFLQGNGILADDIDGRSSNAGDVVLLISLDPDKKNLTHFTVGQK